MKMRLAVIGHPVLDGTAMGRLFRAVNRGPERYVRGCTVSLWNGRRFLGSGFFVAKQIVVTCAHVVRRAGDTIDVVWNTRTLKGRLIGQDPPLAAPDEDPFPDIAFIGVTEAVDHQIIKVEEEAPDLDDSLLVLGYSRYTPEAEVAEDYARVLVAGKGKYLKVRDGVLVPGMSGSPALDRRGLVVGMAKSAMITRDLSSTSPGDGGWLIHGSEILRRFRMHKVSSRARLLTRATLIRPDLRHPLHRMLSAQREAANRYPYRIAKLSSRPVPPLSTVYVEQRTQMRGPESETDDASEWLERLRSRRNVPITPIDMVRRHRHALLVGGPGGGKSTLLQQLVAHSAEWWLRDEPPTLGAQPGLGPVVAIRTAATDLLRPTPWYESIAHAVNNELRGYQTLGVRADMFDQAPVPGAEWLILVDGLDEVMDSDLRHDLIGMLRERVAEYGTTARFVVASRRLDEREFSELRSGLSDFDDQRRLGEYQLRPFDDQMLDTFAGRWFRPPGSPAAMVSPEGFLAMVSDSRLKSLVRIPLLATIAAVVYEENSGESLAGDRSGLYEQFVSWLLTRRNLRPSARESLVSRVAPFGRDAVEFAEFLYDQRRECLTYIADRRLDADERKAEALAEEWFHGHGKRYPLGLDRDLIVEYLLSTGLLEYQGEDLGFIHLSVAEYLAAGLRVAAFSPSEWVGKVRSSGPDSLGLFTASQWVRLGNDIVSAVAQLLPVDGSVTRDDLASAATILEDGAMGDQAESVIELADRVIRGSDESIHGTQLNQMLRSMLQRARSSGILTDLVEDRNVAIAKRVEAAKVMASTGNPVIQAEGIQLLARLAYETGGNQDDRLLATSALAEVGDPAERVFALQHLMSVVETHPNQVTRSSALQALARQGDTASAIMAVLRRSAIPGQSLGERADTLAWLVVLWPDKEADLTQWKFPEAATAGWDLMSRVWTTRLPPGSLTDRGSPVFEEDILPYIATALSLTRVFDPHGTQTVLDTLIHDRSWTWGQRIALARATGHTELSNRALLTLAMDPEELAINRLASLLLIGGAPEREETYQTMIEWVVDEAQDPELRRLALSHLVRVSDEGKSVLEDLVPNQSVNLDLRMAAAALYFREIGDHAWAAASLRGLAWEKPFRWRNWFRVQALRLALLAESWVPPVLRAHQPARRTKSRTAPFTD